MASLPLSALFALAGLAALAIAARRARGASWGTSAPLTCPRGDAIDACCFGVGEAVLACDLSVP
jgi:hypothetical protein